MRLRMSRNVPATGAVAHDLDRARLLDDVERRRIAGRARHVDGRREAAHDRRERERSRCARPTRCRPRARGRAPRRPRPRGGRPPWNVRRRSREKACCLRLPLQQNAAELVFLARLEDRQHLVARLERRRADGDLGLAVAHDGDEARALGQAEALDASCRRRASRGRSAPRRSRGSRGAARAGGSGRARAPRARRAP